LLKYKRAPHKDMFDRTHHQKHQAEVEIELWNKFFFEITYPKYILFIFSKIHIVCLNA
jgi:hypothetical protein